MNHNVSVVYEGDGIDQSAQVVCSCGHKSAKVFAYSGHYWTNQHKFKVDHLETVKRESKSCAQ